MSSLNEVNLIGRLGSDPEVRYMQSGDAVTNISLATSEQWKDKQTGERKEKTEWHRVVFFGKLAEIAGEYLRKGSLVFVKGKLQTRKWQDPEGHDRYSTEVIVDITGAMKMLGGKSEDSSESQPQQTQPASQRTSRPAPSKSAPPVDDFDDSIPF